MISNAALRERNLIRNVTDLLVRKATRNSVNLAIKGGLLTVFLLNLCKANENYNLLKLRKFSKVNTNDFYNVYCSAFSSFTLAALTFLYI